MKVKLLVLVGLLFAVGSYAGDGTGVGGGGGAKREAYLKELHEALGEKLVIRSSVGPSKIKAWCGRATSVLERARGSAYKLYKTGKKNLAEQRLIDALIATGRSMQPDADLPAPMTKWLVDRGIEISAHLDDFMCNQSWDLTDTSCAAFETKISCDKSEVKMACKEGGLEQETKLLFLFDYVKFVTQMSRKLDSPKFVPFRYSYGGCYAKCDPSLRSDDFGGEEIGSRYPECWKKCAPDFDFSDFHKEYVEYARDFLKFVANHFTSVTKGQARPKGDARAFLKIAQLAATYVASDLSNNLYLTQHACSIGGLEDLSLALANYNDGHKDYSDYDTTPQAVNETYWRLKQVIDDIKDVSEACEWQDRDESNFRKYDFRQEESWNEE